MRVSVKILGALTKPQGRGELDVEVAATSRIEDLLLQLGYQRAHLRFILSAVNGIQQKHGHVLEDGDEVTLLMPTSGG